MAKHYAPDIDIEIIRAIDENVSGGAMDTLSYAAQILEICSRICNKEDLNEDSIWDSHTLLYF